MTQVFSATNFNKLQGLPPRKRLLTPSEIKEVFNGADLFQESNSLLELKKDDEDPALWFKKGSKNLLRHKEIRNEIIGRAIAEQITLPDEQYIPNEVFVCETDSRSIVLSKFYDGYKVARNQYDLREFDASPSLKAKIITVINKLQLNHINFDSFLIDKSKSPNKIGMVDFGGMSYPGENGTFIIEQLYGGPDLEDEELEDKINTERNIIEENIRSKRENKDFMCQLSERLQIELGIRKAETNEILERYW